VFGKKFAPICAANRPKMKKSNSSTKLPTEHAMTARRRVDADSNASTASA
jgi:hypothetical protein